MSTIPTPLRRQLETACKEARTIASTGARKALEALAVREPSPYGHMDALQCKLRRKLRDQARQLGDAESQTQRGAHEIKHLVEKLAYDQWHRLLFARFLLENNLLISPEHQVSVSMDDCEELAPSLGLKDAWAVAARFAAKELPQIFRADDPAGAVELAVEDRNPLIRLVTGFPVEVFTASDSLGWCYQFWQAERKDEVNAAGNKIGADELPAVTQLFTEDYMVDFLLDNTLGAWHAGKVLAAKPTLAETAQSEGKLRDAVALPGCPWKYLRFIKAEDGKWTPAAGTFDGWPKTAKELTCLDPCMGSGHFVVAMFERLLALRMVEENLDEAVVVPAVIRDNLFGLEIDPRCTQIGAFNLALAAWRRVGHCKLPAMNLACSGLAPNVKKEDWLKLAGDNYKLQNGMERLHRLFKDAPMLGSLIDPRAAEADLLVAAFHELQPLLEKALAQENKDEATHEMAVTARGLATAAEILAGQFTLVATNVPYLGQKKQDGLLADYCERAHPEAKADLATCFLERCLDFCAPGGTSGLVMPQNWLFQGAFETLRKKLIRAIELDGIVRLGEGGFESSQAAGAFVVLGILTRSLPNLKHEFFGLDASESRLPQSKAARMLTGALLRVNQSDQLNTPENRIVLHNETAQSEKLSAFCSALSGAKTGDLTRFGRCHWEIEGQSIGTAWEAYQTAPTHTGEYSAREMVILWEKESGEMYELAQSVKHLNHVAQNWLRGKPNWGKAGVVVGLMRGIPATIYSGEIYDSACCAIVPSDASDLLPLWAFCSSGVYAKQLRLLDQGLNIGSNLTLVKVPFDIAHWRKAAAEKYPHGLPRPFSSDPTQWLFNGHPKNSDQPLQVAVARLLGYEWPRQTGSSFSDCPALGPDSLEKLADHGGIVCLSATKGEAAAAERLRGFLVQALGKFDLNALIANSGPKGSKSETLDEWLRDEFFEQHCAIFHHRPFIWHVWDGHKSGFSALVNYHKLTHANLEKLTYAYLGDWIRRQQVAVEAGEAGSDSRLQAAKQLHASLKLILEGEPPYDLFVRWKPLSKQPIGWHPDINDGVRMNIRPFATADILRKRVKIKWEKDRGKEPGRDKKDFPWFWGWDEETQDFAGVGDEPDGNRWNDCHYTNDLKSKAREG
jgi:hypothetical protein